MSQLKIKEFSTGKLYISDESANTTSFKLDSVFGNQIEIDPGEAISISQFPQRLEANLNNQVSFLSSCKSAGILPVRVYQLTSKDVYKEPLYILYVTGTYDALLKYFEMFYLPKAESIFETLFHSQNWNLINAESSIGNVAQKGYGISSLDSLDNLLRMIRNGTYKVFKVI